MGGGYGDPPHLDMDDSPVIKPWGYQALMPPERSAHWTSLVNSRPLEGRVIVLKALQHFAGVGKHNGKKLLQFITVFIMVYFGYFRLYYGNYGAFMREFVPLKILSKIGPQKTLLFAENQPKPRLLILNITDIAGFFI